MRYTAASVRAALQEMIKQKGWPYCKDLENLKCPLHDLQHEDGLLCDGNPSTCQRGNEQKCKRDVSVFSANGKTLFVTLNFYFTISSSNFDGFIDADNKMMQLLIAGEHILIDRLVEAY